MTTKKNAGGVAAPAGIANHCKNTFYGPNHNTWHKVKRAHAARALVLAASGRRLSSCPLRARSRQ